MRKHKLKRPIIKKFIIGSLSAGLLVGGTAADANTVFYTEVYAADTVQESEGEGEKPTDTPEPAAPTEAPEPEPTQPEPEPTQPPEPTAEPEPTDTPEPTDIPEPSVTPEASITPEPSATPEPSVTPEVKSNNTNLKELYISSSDSWGKGILKLEFNFNNKLDDYPNLKTVKLSSTVTTIGDSAFEKNSNLKEINLNQVECVENKGLTETGIEQAIFEKEQVQIGENAFNNCTALKDVEVKEVTSWGDASFAECSSLTSFQYEKAIEVIPKQTFMNCAMLSICSLKGVKEVGVSAFLNCASLKTFDFSNVETLSASAFKKAGLTQISFVNENLTLKLNSLVCDDLTGICYPGNKEKWDSISSKAKVPNTTVVHCKADTVEAKAATCTEAGWKEVGVCEVCGEQYSYPTDENAIPATGHTWSEDYVVDKEATCTEAGEKSKHCTVCGVKNEEDVQKIPAAGHKFSDWKVTSEATVFAAEKQERTCATCGAKETRTNGTVLEPTVSVNASNVKLKVKQSTTGLKVTGLAKGDSVKTWKSTNKKIFTVKGKANGTCKLTAKKAGTAKLQITLVSGKQKTIKVKVQKSAVKTTKLTVANKKVTLQKGKKTTLKAVVTPFTSGQKVTYTSSNKKIATVSSKGVVTGKKKGTVKITVKSGSKSVKVTVRVK